MRLALLFLMMSGLALMLMQLILNSFNGMFQF